MEKKTRKLREWSWWVCLRMTRTVFIIIIIIIIIIIVIILPISIWFKKLSLVAYNSVYQLFQGLIRQQWVLWVQTWPPVQRMVSLSEQETLNRVHVIIDDRYWTEHKQFQGLRKIENCITIIKSPSTSVVNFQTNKTYFNHAQFQNNSKITQKKKTRYRYRYQIHLIS